MRERSPQQNSTIRRVGTIDERGAEPPNSGLRNLAGAAGRAPSPPQLGAPVPMHVPLELDGKRNPNARNVVMSLVGSEFKLL